MTPLGPELLPLVAAGLAVVAVGAGVWALFADAAARRERAVRRIDRYGPALAAGATRRRSAEDEVRRHAQAIKARRRGAGGSTRLRLEQAGLAWPVWAAYAAAGGLSMAIWCVTLFAGLAPVPAAGFGAAVGPALFLLYLRIRRVRRKTALEKDFPAALDIIVRGVKTGLPLVDCLRIVAREVPDPLRSEFDHLVEQQGHGLSIGEAVDRFADRVPLSEANFFAIVIGMQTKTGGRLAESLDNLVSVLRARVQLRAKVRSMSAEAKASGGIIAALPVVVSFLVYLTSPQYMGLLITEPIGNVVLLGSALWMLTGVLVMGKMIRFDS